MYFTGFADEASTTISGQIKATKMLGWSNIEARNINNRNIHDLPEADFEMVVDELNSSDIKINCFGSTVANWACDPFSEQDFATAIDTLKRALTRMNVLGTKMIRGMSFVAQDNLPAFSPEVENQVFKKVKYLVSLCEDAGVIYLHENCRNYGGQSWKHTLKLLDVINSPNFQLVFDTGNPVFAWDRSSSDKLNKKQDAWFFYHNVREYIRYVHIKDCRYIKETGNIFPECEFTYPGEGDGQLEKIVFDLLDRGYDGGWSIEPHMKIVFHANRNEVNEEEKLQTYLKYGKSLMALVEKHIRK